MKKGSFSSSKGAHLLEQLQAQTAQQARKEKQSPAPPTIEDELRAAAASRKSLRDAPDAHGRKFKPKKPKKEIVRLTRALREQYIAQTQAMAPRHDGPADVHEPGHNDLGKRDFEHIQATNRGMELNAFVASHSAPETVSSSEAELVKRRLERGSLAFSSSVDESGMSFFIGYDFGTSTTKVIARSPHEALRNAFAIEVPPGMRCGGSPHLWPTAIWFDPRSGCFSLTPGEGLVRLDSFKSALIRNYGNRICAGSGVTMAEAATAFLAMHVAYVVGACLERNPSFTLSGINFAVPVAALAERRIVSTFDDLIGASLSLVGKASALTIRDVRDAPRNVGPLPFVPVITTELAGAIAGYCAAPRHHLGGHMIIDCGSGTLDIASFLLAADQLRPIAIYAAQVEPMGADACEAYERLGASAETCRRAARYQEHLVYADTIARDSGYFRQDRGAYPYQIILTGGGIHSSTLAPFLERMEMAFHRPFYRPELSSDVEYELRCEAGRLILADGLARDPAQLRDVVMPADRPQLCSPQVEFVSKDQV